MLKTSILQSCTLSAMALSCLNGIACKCSGCESRAAFHDVVVENQRYCFVRIRICIEDGGIIATTSHEK